MSSEKQMNQVMNDAFAFWGTISPSGEILTLSGDAFKKANVDPTLLVGQYFAETVFWQSSVDMSARLTEAIKNANREGSSSSKLVFRISAKEQINIDLRIKSQNGEKSLFICAVDITESEAEISDHNTRRENLSIAAEAAEIGLWLWDLIENKITITPKCLELFGMAANTDVTFESFLAILHTDDRSEVEAKFLDSRKYGGEYRSEFRVVYPDGEIHWISARGRSTLNTDGDCRMITGMFQAITEKKLATEKLSKVYGNEKKARDVAEEANRAKDFFLAVISHELRTPLNAILGWTKILLGKELDLETRRKALVTIETSARSQAKLLDDLLDSSRVASGRLKLVYREIDLFEIIKTVLTLQKPTADAKNIEIDLHARDLELKVFGDAIRLQQVISNLLSNALKFTPDGGRIKVETSIEKQNVIVRVSDSGQGIEPESLPHIFRQFRQGGDSSVEKGGLGLGLSIAKILVEKHGGLINAESKGLGHGSTFTITLPVFDESQLETGADSTDKDQPLKGLKILVVEDETNSREVLGIFLQQNGAEVISAESAAEALKLLGELTDKLPDIILSDLAMPDGDGFTLLKRIRENTAENGGSIPALAISAFSSADDKEKAMESGFQKYHTKPFDPDQVIRDILQLLKEKAV